ncbi:hypothetical protein [Halopiger xanaduensis]|uniref:Uncharacterized protein n=1 Tax=Halopiger xanaduensis (strain DSM 18323 / JCM 14033 / SH-6) TaxID=797210 RepID=F8D7S5_HALXS|nr:hypothetical protein [Halopiger xanaduensis]AEH35528.1 hypothetical protein Halxa_0891 [Halopiger xanaduensis SH-6]
MVPDLPSLSRRQLLGGLAGGAAVGSGFTAVTAAVRPTALPDILTDWATNHYPTPPAASSLWQPTVTEAHAREAVSLLDETQTAAENRRDEFDAEDSSRRFHGAGGWLEDAEASLEAGDYNDALFEARYGLQFAGQELGELRAELDKADLEALAERTLDLLDRLDSLAAALEPYPVVDPERDLARYSRVELELQRGRHLADWGDLTEVRADPETDEPDLNPASYDADDIGEITSKIRRAEIAVESAERYDEHLRTDLEDAGAETTDYGPHLEELIGEFKAELESMPTRDEVESRYVDDDAESYGPYEFAHWRLARACFPSRLSSLWRSQVGGDLRVLQVLGTARGLADWRAHEAAVDDFVVDPDDEGFDSGHAFAAKRRARSVFRSVVGSDPTPFVAVLAEPGIADVRMAEIDRGSWADDDSSWTPWRERVQAYLHALRGRTRLQAYPDVYERIVSAG